MLRAAIIGAAGYTGSELVRLIHRHPELSLAMVAARDNAGKRLEQVVPSTLGVKGVGELMLEPFDPEQARELAQRVDVAFLGLPHAASAKAGKALYDAGVRVVDLSADFRLKSREAYEKTYGPHPAPELFEYAVYGMPELHREELTGARLIAAPGCYPTSCILAARPAAQGGAHRQRRHHHRFQERRERRGPLTGPGVSPAGSGRGHPALQGRRRPPSHRRRSSKNSRSPRRRRSMWSSRRIWRR